jgi:mannose/fructose/N-acetylgalactosamine-specific phosphotransferase system component IID
MTRNMGKADRLARSFLVAPTLIVAATLAGSGSIVGVVLFAVAAIMLATSAVGYCPTYTLLHVTTQRQPLPGS